MRNCVHADAAPSGPHLKHHRLAGQRVEPGVSGWLLGKQFIKVNFGRAVADSGFGTQENRDQTEPREPAKMSQDAPPCWRRFYTSPDSLSNLDPMLDSNQDESQVVLTSTCSG